MDAAGEFAQLVGRTHQPVGDAGQLHPQPFRKRVKACPESARCCAGVDRHRVVWVVPWRCPLPVWCGSCGFPSGSFTVAHASSGRTCRPLASSTSWARLRAAPEITIQHEAALLAVVGAFG